MRHLHKIREEAPGAACSLPRLCTSRTDPDGARPEPGTRRGTRPGTRPRATPAPIAPTAPIPPAGIDLGALTDCVTLARRWMGER